MKRDALRKMAELTCDIKTADEEKELAKIAVDALHSVSGSLKSLIIFLTQAAMLWSQFGDYSRELSNSSAKQRIIKALEEQREYLGSNDFKERFYRYSCQWVALKSVNDACYQQIKATQQELFKYITENPTSEESRQNLKDLVGHFEKDLKAAQKHIEELDTKDHLMYVLHPHEHKWRDIGGALGFSVGELENIRQNFPVAPVEQLLRELLSQWTQWPTETHPETPTMEMLQNALRSGPVGLGAVAEKLQLSWYVISA